MLGEIYCKNPSCATLFYSSQCNSCPIMLQKNQESIHKMSLYNEVEGFSPGSVHGG